MKGNFFVVLMAVALMALTACKSKEESVIDKLNALTERVEKDGSSFDADDWQKAIEDFAKINKEAQDCEFSSEQLKELGKAEGRLSAIFLQEGAKALNQEASEFVKSCARYLSGFKEGVEDSFDEEDLEEYEETISSQLESFFKDLDD